MSLESSYTLSPKECALWQHRHRFIDENEMDRDGRLRCPWCNYRLSGYYHDSNCPVRPLLEVLNAAVRAETLPTCVQEYRRIKRERSAALARGETVSFTSSGATECENLERQVLAWVLLTAPMCPAEWEAQFQAAALVQKETMASHEALIDTVSQQSHAVGISETMSPHERVVAMRQAIESARRSR